MFNKIRKIDDTAIKVDQVKKLMGTLIEHSDMTRANQENIIHIAFDILSEAKKELIEVSTTLTDCKIS